MCRMCNSPECKLTGMVTFAGLATLPHEEYGEPQDPHFCHISMREVVINRQLQACRRYCGTAIENIAKHRSGSSSAVCGNTIHAPLLPTGSKPKTYALLPRPLLVIVVVAHRLIRALCLPAHALILFTWHGMRSPSSASSSVQVRCLAARSSEQVRPQDSCTATRFGSEALFAPSCAHTAQHGATRRSRQW